MLNAVDDGYGGLEHRNSTALICNRTTCRATTRDQRRTGGRRLHHPAGPDQPRVLPHLERQAPAASRVRELRLCTRENYTRLLWFFEGFTSYYDDLLLRRAGLLDDAAYLKLLTKTINQVQHAGPAGAVGGAGQL
jgi:predicted metalloprotease with PDZ domain